MKSPSEHKKCLKMLHQSEINISFFHVVMAAVFLACCSHLLLNASSFSIYRFTESIFGVSKEYECIYQGLFSHHLIIVVLAK